MFSFKKRRTYPEVAAGAGCAHVPGAQSLAKDDTLGVQLAAPPIPDFDSVAREAVTAAHACQAFHQTGIDQFSTKLVFSLEQYTAQVDQAASRLKSELESTYRASLESQIKAYELQLADLSHGMRGASDDAAGKKAPVKKNSPVAKDIPAKTGFPDVKDAIKKEGGLDEA